MSNGYWAISWWNAYDELVEWVILPSDEVAGDARCCPIMADMVSNPGNYSQQVFDDGVMMNSPEMYGAETNPAAAKFMVCGAFDNVMSAQYFVDSKWMPDDE